MASTPLWCNGELRNARYKVEANSPSQLIGRLGADGASSATGYLVKEDSRFLIGREDYDVRTA